MSKAPASHYTDAATHNGAAPSGDMPLLARQRPTSFWHLWPIGALLLTEVFATMVVAPPRPGEIQFGSLVLAIAVFVAGIVPALIRPSVATNLVGCSTVVLAALVWRGPSVLVPLTTLSTLAFALDTLDVRLSLFNLVLLGPLILHLAAVFPQRSRLTTRLLVGYYALVVAITTATCVLPMPWREAALVGLLITTYAGFGIAGYQFWQTIQQVQPAYPRAAQQARLVLLSLILAEAPFLLLPWSQFIRLFIPYEVVVGAQIILPIGVAYTTLRTDLFGIDRALRRTLDYGLVSFGLLVIYFGLTTLLTQASREVGGTWGFVATVVSVVAAAAAFPPLRRNTQRVIDRVFYPERLAFGQAISAARTTVSQVVQRSAVVALLEDELPQKLGATWAKIVLRPSFDQPPHAAQPGVWSTLLLVGGQPLGCYWLGPRRSGLKYDPGEQEQLLGLLQQAALGLAYAETFDNLVQLNEELEERVATRTKHLLAQQRELATWEERQRLARDLHDSVKQTLFSLGLGLRSVRNRMGSDPEVAEALRQQEQAALQAQAEMGQLLAQLRTPASEPVDLVAILVQHSAWLGQHHGLQIMLDMPPSVTLPTLFAHELVQIVKEALHNVLRHSGVAQAHLTLLCEDNCITLSIVDHGRGFHVEVPHHGYGLRGMRERIAALGGQLVVQAAPTKGTTVWGQVAIPDVALGQQSVL